MDEQKIILIVDDTVENITVLDGILRPEYKTIAAKNGKKAISLAIDKKPDLILLDVMMPEMDGYEVLNILKKNPDLEDIPVMFVTAKGETQDETYGLELGAVDYIVKPVVPAIVLARVKTQLELMKARIILKNQNQILEQRVVERTKELLLTRDVTFQGLAALAETRDNDTGAHIQRTSEYVKVLSRELLVNSLYKDEITSENILDFTKSAPLHDIGKVGVSDLILLKPGKLDDDEFKLMKMHTTYGSDAILKAENRLGSNSFLKTAREIALNHHERWDGKGYPNQKKGLEIPLSGRIMAVADVYDALISKRVYKAGMPHEQAIGIIEQGSGTQFDPEIVRVFLSVKDKISLIASSIFDAE